MDRSAISHALSASQLLTENAAVFLSVITEHGEDPEALYQKAVSYYNLHRFKECLNTLKALLKADRTSSQAYRLQALVFRAQNKYLEANEALDNLISLNPHDAQAHFHKALNFEDLNQLDLAEAALDAALALQHDLPEFHFKKGVLLSLRNQKEKALHAYSAAVALNPQNEDYLFSRGICRVQLELWDAALLDFDSALKLIPSFGEAAIWKCQILQRQGGPSEALRYLDSIIDSASDTEASMLSAGPAEDFTDETMNEFRLLRVRLLLENGDLHQAVQRIDADLIEKMGLREAWLYRAVIDHQLGNSEAAMTYVCKAISADQNKASLYVFRSILFLQAEKPKALNDIQKASQLCGHGFEDLYLRSEQQKRLHKLFEVDLDLLIPVLDELVNSLCFLDMNFRRWIRQPSDTETRFVPLVAKYKGALGATILLLSGLFHISVTQADVHTTREECSRLNEQLLSMSQEFSILLTLSPQKQSILSLKLQWDCLVQEDPAVAAYACVFYGTLVSYFRHLGHMKQESFEIPVDEIAFEFPRLKNQDKVGCFQVAHALLCEHFNINRKFGSQTAFETVFESRAGDRKGHKLRLLLLETAVRIATNEAKKSEVAMAKNKLGEMQEAAWEALRSFLKSHKKYDYIKKVVDSPAEKMGFLDAFYASVYVNSHPADFADANVEVKDRFALIVLANRHLQNVRERMQEGQRMSKLENLLKRF